MSKIISKIISLVIIFNLAACANEKRHEEIQYYGFNEKNKSSVKKEEIYMTRVTNVENLTNSITDINNKYGGNVKKIGSWDFTQKPSNTIKDEIIDKAVELGSNHVILFEKKDCDTIDIKKNEVDVLPGSNCYNVIYYTLPILTKKDYTVYSKPEVSAPEPVPAPKTAVEVIPSATFVAPAAAVK